MTLQEKIKAFKHEIGTRNMNDEQKKIYAAFTKENGSNINFNVVDCKGKALKLRIKSSVSNKILQKHYLTRNGSVTATDILYMFDVVRTGICNKSCGNDVYTK